MNTRIHSITKAVLTITAAAAASATLLLAVAWPALLDAKDPAAAKAPPVLLALASPSVTIQGCKLTVVPPKTAAASGAGSVVRIKAANTTDRPVRFDAMLTALSQSPASRFSRRLVLPSATWQDGFEVALGPKEDKTYELTVPATVLNGKQLVTFRVTEASKAPKIRNPKAAVRLPIAPKAKAPKAAAKPARSVR